MTLTKLDSARCIFCNKLLRYVYTDTVQRVYRCDICIMSFIYHRDNSEWFFLENRQWETNYGKWVACTIEINKAMKEIVEFT